VLFTFNESINGLIPAAPVAWRKNSSRCFLELVVPVEFKSHAVAAGGTLESADGARVRLACVSIVRGTILGEVAISVTGEERNSCGCRFAEHRSIIGPVELAGCLRREDSTVSDDGDATTLEKHEEVPANDVGVAAG
jgi:hypothetical protein